MTNNVFETFYRRAIDRAGEGAVDARENTPTLIALGPDGMRLIGNTALGEPAAWGVVYIPTAPQAHRTPTPVLAQQAETQEFTYDQGERRTISEAEAGQMARHLLEGCVVISRQAASGLFLSYGVNGGAGYNQAAVQAVLNDENNLAGPTLTPDVLGELLA